MKPRVVILSDIPSRQRALISIALRKSGTSVLFRSDKNFLSETARSGLQLRLERFLVALVYSGLASVSPLTRDYYKWRENRLNACFPYSTRLSKFKPPHAEILARRYAIRESLSIPYSHYTFVSAAKFVDRENPWQIIHSFESLQEKIADTSLIALGDGPLLEDVRSYCRKKCIRNIHFPGYVRFSMLQDYFFAADSFLHFAEIEPWGVSVQDALVSGMPVVATRNVGSAQVLLRPELDRFLVDAGDKAAAADRMLELSQHKNVAEMFYPAHVRAMAFSSENVARDLISLTQL